ncbi:HamA C-terminal domain-containing protein [Cellulomonas fimi]|uniref:HamA C-terminal domain-containing protein n=1 Tax=Cellulomonas fimi TaxID=1708 RepID=UPI002359EC8E|nr:DUF1837 domain-containing protein [Cellulomonas fimi]
MPNDAARPDTVLEVVVTQLDDDVPLLGVCAGFEDGAWRHRQLSYDLVQWATDWILSADELEEFSSTNHLDLFNKALSRVYETIDYKRRGEVGELLLHIILRTFLKSERLITRIYFKDAANDTVKGFDAVHVVESGQEDDGTSSLELWLGEAKFYTDSRSAMAEIYEELRVHLQRDYLRYEFAAISDKIPRAYPHRDEIRALLARKTSLDAAFRRVVIPVFITYDSDVTGKHGESSQVYLQEIEAELAQEWETFKRRYSSWTLPRTVRAHLFLLPMATKQTLVDAFDGRLKAWQTATKP